MKTGDEVYLVLRECVSMVFHVIITKIENGKIYVSSDMISDILTYDDIEGLLYLNRDDVFKKMTGEYVEYDISGGIVVNVNGVLMVCEDWWELEVTNDDIQC